MTPNQHAAVSVSSGLFLGVILRSWAAGLSCCLIGIFIDLDHLLDYWINRGFSLNIRDFLDFCYHGTSPTFYVILHGYEFIPAYLWLTTIPVLRPFGWGLTVGYSLHLLGDQFFNNHLNRWTYFFSFRLFHRFSSSHIVLSKPFWPGGRPPAML
ncbi:MAG TPA: hypothetical protein VE398_04420 [Acidobacteriota bacterium]|nr:hypothetical protein [Acidobacteriota bacterium]